MTGNTTNTQRNLASLWDFLDAVLAAVSDRIEGLAVRARSAQQRAADAGSGAPRTRTVNRRNTSPRVAEMRIGQLDAAVARGDLDATEVRDLRAGYERARVRDDAGLPPLDLTY
ncbi:MAG TPA: hypothetical protein VKB03_01020 [Conexibacter sp.]|nr:hypothetical protein [Conexibacter sp.]